MLKLRDRRKSQGLCQYCGNKLDRKGICCTACNKQYNIWKEEYRTNLIRNARCIQCGKSLDREGLYCSTCCKDYKLKARIRYAERREMGLCVQCGEQAEEGRKYCRKCLDQRMERYYKNKR